MSVGAFCIALRGFGFNNFVFIMNSFFYYTLKVISAVAWPRTVMNMIECN